MRHWRPDPMTEDESVLAAQAEEDAREQRWAQFILDCSRWGHARMARAAAFLYSDGEVSISPTQDIIAAFAETEGWAGVFAALARASKEHEALPDDAEMERRR